MTADGESHKVIDFFDIRYYANITVGSPLQEFRVQLCTASNEFWILSKECTKEHCDVDKRTGYEHHKYDADKSGTYEFDGRYYSVKYDGGMVAGHMAKDTVRLGHLIIKNQLFGSVDTLAGYLTSEDHDGIMGLGWPSLGKDIVPPLYSIKDILDEPLFTVWLARHDQLREGEPGGAITYGGTDKEHCDGNINYVKLENETDQWKLNVAEVKTKFKNSTAKVTKDTYYISNTASPFIDVPKSIFSAFISGIDVTISNGYYNVDCNVVNKLHSINFTINGVEYVVPPTELVLEMQKNPSKCVLAVTNSDANVLGEPFIRRYCHVYDYGNKRIGLAPSRSFSDKRFHRHAF
ncbi:unnamed protein product [Bursaphelenchus okinawaensis]|uniref:Peptidase A1 domain-containing protein n=1 Tax=Bursaphelenchus okinawaensis TaxID=465554 RepID=A0A811L0S3_9BILA|nr:unnamed protein product [Bursaphelenchus okinawaensis]CAG9115334.1 unnamed protein product [Bursaphelenchus okinawaensis]